MSMMKYSSLKLYHENNAGWGLEFNSHPHLVYLINNALIKICKLLKKKLDYCLCVDWGEIFYFKHLSTEKN